ncbi:hypothetical protein RJZ57_004927 [Blastomyces gilchristii]
MTTITTTSLKNTTATASLLGGIPSTSMISTAENPATTTTTTIDCPSCGYDVRLADDDAQQRIISELEAQVRFLNKRAAETGRLFLSL